MLSSPNILWQLWQQHTGSKWFPSMYTRFSSVKWCYLNPLLVPPALRHDPHNSAPTCARLPTRNSIKYRETNTRTVPNARRITEMKPLYTCTGTREPVRTFRIIFRSYFFFPFLAIIVQKEHPQRHRLITSERTSFCCTFTSNFLPSLGAQVNFVVSLHSFLRHKSCPCLFCMEHGQNAASTSASH